MADLMMGGTEMQPIEGSQVKKFWNNNHWRVTQSGPVTGENAARKA
jgi:hypothetical protein